MTTLLALLLAPALASDLTVDGTTVTLDGTQSYDNIYVINGGSIVVSDYDGTGTTGTLILEADYIEVDSTSSIVADGAGYIGQTDGDGEGPGGGAGGSSYDDGGGGGAHGGDGGDGVMDDCTTPDGPGGTSYGDVTATNIDMGSAGGAAGAADGDSGGEGASGGGAITLSAAWIVMEGTISANGDAGTEVNDDATGGGAGGGVLIVADELDCDGTIEAMGGDGGSADDAGGGGGGGVVKQFYDSSINSCSVDTDGGEAECSATDGDGGLEVTTINDFDGDGYTTLDGDCDTADSSISPGATEIWYDGVDQDCDEASDYDQDGDGHDSDAYGGDDCDDADTAVNPERSEERRVGIDS